MRLTLLLVSALLPGLLFAQSPTKVKTAEAVALIRSLERNPLAANAPVLRSDLFDWIEQTPDVTVTICDVLGPLPAESNLPYGRELVLQSMLGNAAFKLERPENAHSEVKAQVAGITSMLRAYAKIIAADPKAHIPEYDAWLADLKAGKLADRVTPAIREKCLEQATEV